MPLAVDRYELGPTATNCYVVRASRAAPEAVVVDPGADAASLRLELARMGARCAGILVTHCHFDHVGAVADLAEGTGAPVYTADGEAVVLERPDEFFAAYGVRIRPYSADVRLSGNEQFELGGVGWRTLLVPGHSPAHLAYFVEGALFSGDVVFAGSVGRTDVPGGDWEQLLESLRALTDEFPPETVVYPGHGPPTTLGEEHARNPFLADLRAAARGDAPQRPVA